MNKILPILVMMILSGSTVFAEMRGPGIGMGMRYGYGLGACGDPELNLNPAQAEKVKHLQRRYLTELRQLQRDFLRKRVELKMLNSGTFEEIPDLSRRQQEIQAIHEKMREAWLNYKMECRGFLTSEQLEQLGSIEKRRMHRPGMGWGNR